MKLKWIVLFSFGFFAAQASAEKAIVIDAEMLGEQPAATTGQANPPAQVDGAAASQADANKERILKGGKMSSRQKTAMAKAELSDTNLQQGEAFLAKNKAKPGVISLPSGLQYKILRAGQGKKPTGNSVAMCRLRGALLDGTEFEKSDGKKLAALNVAGLLPGLKEAVMLMPTGSKWQIVVPPQLAYGALGDRGVGPNAVLIYDMEIVSIK